MNTFLEQRFHCRQEDKGDRQNNGLHNGAEMIISDTSQIEIEVKAKSRVSKRAVRFYDL